MCIVSYGQKNPNMTAYLFELGKSVSIPSKLS